MYESFRVQNFRGFEHLELNDLARVNLIAGKNNTGKTSLLEAIAVYSGHYEVIVRRLSETFTPMPKYITQYSNQSKIDWSKLFFLFNEDINIIMQGKGFFDKEETIGSAILNIQIVDIKDTPSEHLENPSTYFRNQIEHSNSLWFRFGESDAYIIQAIKDYEYSRLHYRNKTKHPRLPISMLFNIRDEDPRLLLDFFTDLKKQRRTDILVEVLQLFDANIRGVELLGDGLYVDIPKMPRLVSLESMGEGVQRVVEILLNISAQNNNRILLIDEIENGLHHSVQEDVWKAIAEAAEQFNVQVFATTHSREMAMAAHRAFKSRKEYNFRYHRLDRDKKTGLIYPTTYDELTMNDAMEMGAEVR